MFVSEAIDFESFAYDVTPDGQGFFAHLPHGPEAPPSITVVFNWTTEVSR